MTNLDSILKSGDVTLPTKVRIVKAMVFPVKVKVKSLSRVRLFVTPWTEETGFPVHHQLLETTQTHAHHIGDAIQPSHPLLPSSLPVLNLSQHQGLFQ